MNFVQAFLVLQCQNGLKPMRRAIFSSLPPLPSPWEHTDSLNHKLLQPSRSRRKMIFSFPQQSRYSFTLAQQNSVEYTHGMLFRLRKNMWPFCKIVSSLHVLLFVDAYLRHNTFTEDFWVVPFQYDFLLNFFFRQHFSIPPRKYAWFKYTWFEIQSME